MRTIIALVLLAACTQSVGPQKRVVHEASGIAFVLVPAEKPFYLSETEVTVAQFRRFVEASGYVTDAERGAEEGGHTVGAFAAMPEGEREWNAAASWRRPFPHLADYRIRDDHPVVQVSWNDARRFSEHFGLRLPTDAEWLFAAGGEGNVADARGGKRFRLWNSVYPHDDGVELLSPVGAYPKNRWGVYDMTGNVGEWCEDRFGATMARVVRGSSWLDGPLQEGPAAKAGMMPASRRDFIGFRVAMDVYHHQEGRKCRSSGRS